MNTEQTAQQLRLAADIIETGRPWEVQLNRGWQRMDSASPLWSIANGCEIRLALATPPDGRPFQLPPAPPGMEWHRKDGWEEGDLPQGWRPLVVGEEEHDEDEFGSRINNAWMPTPDSGKVVGAYYKVRTRRPLTFTHEGTTWTWHRPDDPMPCDGEKKVVLLRTNREEYADDKYSSLGKEWTWDDPSIIGWRYAVEPKPTKTVPLGPEDVPPGSVFRRKSRKDESDCWTSVLAINSDGVVVGDSFTTYSGMKDDLEINRSIPLTGKWDANAWEPCSKEVAV